MQRLIDADALYEQIAKKEELARQRVLDTPSRMPNGDLNPSAIRYFTQLDERTQMKFMIADAPTIDAEPQWIPVSERLPKESGIYLVTLKTDGVAHFESEFPNGFVYCSAYDAVIMHWGYGDKNVIAWMPLPEPYIGEE